jgi:hypothetical protein
MNDANKLPATSIIWGVALVFFAISLKVTESHLKRAILFRSFSYSVWSVPFLQLFCPRR